MKWLLVFGLFLFGCASFSKDQVRVKTVYSAGDTPELPGYTDSQCYDLMKARDNWMFTAKLLGGLGGASAIVTPIPEWPDAARWGIGAGAATLTVTGVAAAWVGESKSKTFERNCEVK